MFLKEIKRRLHSLEWEYANIYEEDRKILYRLNDDFIKLNADYMGLKNKYSKLLEFMNIKENSHEEESWTGCYMKFDGYEKIKKCETCKQEIKNGT